MIIAVDFDGTIVPDIFFPDRKPDRFMPGAKEALTELHRRGHALVLWTLRDHDRWKISRTLQIAVDFLNANGLGFMILPSQLNGYFPNTPKFPADIYIDDKIPGGFQGWDAIMRALVNDGAANGTPTGKRNEADGMCPNSGSYSRTDNLDHPGVAQMRRKARPVNEPIHGPLSVGRENDRNQAEPFHKAGCPLHGSCLDIGTFYNQGPVKPEIDRPFMTGLDVCLSFAKMTPLEFERLVCNAKTGNDDTPKRDAIVHANPDRHDGEDD